MDKAEQTFIQIYHTPPEVDLGVGVFFGLENGGYAKLTHTGIELIKDTATLDYIRNHYQSLAL